MYICPICKKNLTKNGNLYKCKNNHCFDLSKTGYLNLLTTKGRNPKKAGDNADMIRSRSDFLDKNYYRPLAFKVSEIVSNDCKSRNLTNPIIIDSGCGEGYYTSILHNALPDSYIYGVDISKHGIAHAAKRMSECILSHVFLCVGSSFDLPFKDRSCDTIISIFAPVTNDEYKRVLRPGGKLFIVAPDQYHLFGLKEILYEVPYTNKENDYGLTDFVLDGRYDLKYNISIDNQDDINNLFTMTPYYYKTSEEAVQKLKTVNSLTTQCDFTIYEYRKK